MEWSRSHAENLVLRMGQLEKTNRQLEHALGLGPFGVHSWSTPGHASDLSTEQKLSVQTIQVYH